MFQTTKTTDVTVVPAVAGFVLSGFRFKPTVKHPDLRAVAEALAENSFPICAWKMKGDGTVEPLTYVSVDPCDVRFIFSPGKITELDNPAKPSWPTQEAWTQYVLQVWKDRLHIAKQQAKAAVPAGAISFPAGAEQVQVPVFPAA